MKYLKIVLVGLILIGSYNCKEAKKEASEAAEEMEETMEEEVEVEMHCL